MSRVTLPARSYGLDDVERFEAVAAVDVNTEFEPRASDAARRDALDVEVVGRDVGAFDAARRSSPWQSILVGPLLERAEEAGELDLLEPGLAAEIVATS